MNITKLCGVVALAMAAAACSSLPERVDSLEQARASVRTLEQDPLASEAARVELSQAREAIAAADQAYANGESLELIEHQAYLAGRHADIAEQRIAQARAEDELQESRAERDRVLLQARERQAERAEALAAERGETADALAARLKELEAEQTGRGMVLTLGDVLFDTDEARLKPGAASTMDRLAGFMRDYPDRRVLIEGHTDASGPAQYNVQLSVQRADAARDALIRRGISPQRIRMVGLGEEYPVASNQTQAGMQQNRRVEIVISDEDGDFPAAARERMAAGQMGR